MNQYISTQIRHVGTFIVGLFTFLIGKGLLTSEEAEPVVAKVDGFLDLVIPIVSVILMRLLMLAFVKFKALQWLKDLSSDELLALHEYVKMYRESLDSLAVSCSYQFYHLY
ncbi:MAG: hypothetical protein ACSHXL_06770 [Bacteroidota bacterium]